MKVLNSNSAKLNTFKHSQKNITNNIAFGTALGTKASREMGKALKAAIQKLHIKYNVVTIHSPSLPPSKSKLLVGGFNDTGVGTYCGKNLKKTVKFFKEKFGITAFQFGPDTKITPGNFSPYSGSSFTAAKHLLDRERLVDDKLLSKETFIKYAKKCNTAIINQAGEITDYYKMDYKHMFNTSGAIIDEVYENFKKLLPTSPLKKEYEEFLNTPQIKYWLENDALFYVAMPQEYKNISKYAGKFWVWDDIDKKLNLYLADKGSSKYKEALERRRELLSKYKDDIEKFKVEQFLIHKQRVIAKSVLKNEATDALGDLKISNGSSDVWGHPKAFLVDFDKNEFQGLNCNSKNDWNFYALNPEAQEARDFLAKKIENIGLYYDGIRLDFVPGYLEPYIRKIKIINEYDSNGILNKMLYENLKDDAKRVNLGTSLLETINQSVTDLKIKKDLVFGENVDGVQNPLTCATLKKIGIAELRNDNPNIALSKKKNNYGYGYNGYNGYDGYGYGNYYGGHNADDVSPDMLKILNETLPSDKLKQYDDIWIATSSHDTETLFEKVKDLKERKALIATNYKGSRTNQEGVGHKIQTFFADFIGMKQRYNNPFKNANEEFPNWSTRNLPEMEEYYYRKVANGEAINMPEALLDAAERKALDINSTQEAILGKDLIEKLQYFSKKLSDKTGPFRDETVDMTKDMLQKNPKISQTSNQNTTQNNIFKKILISLGIPLAALSVVLLYFKKKASDSVSARMNNKNN